MGRRKSVGIGYDKAQTASPWYIRVNGKKSYYPTQKERDDAHSAKLAEVEAFGFGVVLDVSAADRLAVAEMRRQADRLGMDPMEVFRRGLELASSGPKLSVPEAVTKYLAHCKSRVDDGTMRKNTCKDLGHMLTKFAAHVGEIPMAAVTTAVVNEWGSHGSPSSNTRSNRVARVSMLFGWLIKSGLAEKNPCHRPKVARRTPVVFAVDTVASLFRMAEKIRPEIVPMMALQWFAGMRPNATQWLRWEDVDFTRKVITIQAGSSKSVEPEFVSDLPPTVWFWLRKYRKATGRIAPGKHAQYYQEVKRACGIEGWPSDVARHTFASNLYALTGSIEDVARALLHHTTRITLKHYVAMGVKKAAARRFFGLRPA